MARIAGARKRSEAEGPRKTVRHVGIDENGLGSRLGPMTVTGVRLELDEALARDGARLRKVCGAAGIADSKAVAAHGAMARTEARVLALMQVHLGETPSSLRAWTEAMTLGGESGLRVRCPTSGDAATVCFGDEVTLPAFGAGPTREDFAAAERLSNEGVRVASVRVAVVCARALNEAKARGESRFDVDLAAMVRLMGALKGEATAGPLQAFCGKVGGRKSYSAGLEALSPLCSVLSEERGRSSYAVAGFGDVHFVMDGDATEPSIGLASLFGKYARELWMERHNRHWVRAVPGQTPVSGYHDPVTDRLVRATELLRRDRGIEDACFVR